jgi:hypothetical protein
LEVVAPQRFVGASLSRVRVQALGVTGNALTVAGVTDASKLAARRVRPLAFRVTSLLSAAVQTLGRPWLTLAATRVVDADELARLSGKTASRAGFERRSVGRAACRVFDASFGAGVTLATVRTSPGGSPLPVVAAGLFGIAVRTLSGRRQAFTTARIAAADERARRIVDPNARLVAGLLLGVGRTPSRARFALAAATVFAANEGAFRRIFERALRVASEQHAIATLRGIRRAFTATLTVRANERARFAVHPHTKDALPRHEIRTLGGAVAALGHAFPVFTGQRTLFDDVPFAVIVADSRVVSVATRLPGGATPGASSRTANEGASHWRGPLAIGVADLPCIAVALSLVRHAAFRSGWACVCVGRRLQGRVYFCRLIMDRVGPYTMAFRAALIVEAIPVGVALVTALSVGTLGPRGAVVAAVAPSVLDAHASEPVVGLQTARISVAIYVFRAGRTADAKDADLGRGAVGGEHALSFPGSGVRSDGCILPVVSESFVVILAAGRFFLDDYRLFDTEKRVAAGEEQ